MRDERVEDDGEDQLRETFHLSEHFEIGLIGGDTVCFRVQRTFGTPLFSGLGGQIRLIF